MVWPEEAAVSDAADNASELPRQQSGSQPQRLLLTLLGDYWYGKGEHIPSAALVRLLGEFGVSSGGARAALSRLARRNLLESSKRGRHTYYGLTGRASAVLSEGGRRILRFGTYDAPWNGNWAIVVFSVPEAHRHTRHALRTRLRWLGFAPLYDGVWVSPHGSVDAVTALLDELAVETSTVVIGRTVPTGSPVSNPVHAWDLEKLRVQYQKFIDEFAPLLERVSSGEVGAAEGLLTRTSVMDTWRNFPNLDPELPPELLPRGWPRGEARATFAAIYDGLGPLAEVRVRQILAEHSPELARLVSHHTTADELS